MVTGASYGIGFAIASAFAKQGATICFNDLNQDLVNKGLAAYKERGIEAHGYVCNVCDEAAVQEMVARIAKEVGTIDILVNNAGIIKRIPMHEMKAEEFRQVIDVDLNAPFIVSKAVLPAMMEKGHGKIINICSMMSELGRETVSAYAAAKGGSIAFVKSLAQEIGKYGITVNGVAPGIVQRGEITEQMKEHLSKTNFMGTYGTPEDIASMVLFLCSNKASFITGQNIPVDGGRSLGLKEF